MGPCSGSFRQWYYDAAGDNCYEFDYGGCQGNPNRFNNAYECQQRCQRTRTPSTVSPPYVYPEEERETERQPERGDAGQRPSYGDGNLTFQFIHFHLRIFLKIIQIWC